MMFALAALAIILGGLWLPVVGADIADQTSLNRGLMGTIFVAAATSLPELSVSLAALRLGSVNMAIANLLGSNLFNMLILAIEDLVYFRGALLDLVATTHAVTAMAAVIMCGIVIAGLLYRPKTRLFRTVGWTSIALFSVYILNVYFAFTSAI
jgi:cation:H+ antiporter